MVNNFIKEIKLPKTIPIFPLKGVVMFPDTYLPLNIFEPRYLKMIDQAISNENRLIGMIQPKNIKESDDESSLFEVGCAGKIIKFEETEDNRYLITLKGLSRFNLISESINNKNFKEANINWKSFSKDLDLKEKTSDFSTLKTTLKKYFKLKKIRANMDAIDSFNDYNFADQITMICPLEINEKQLLLETFSLTKRINLLQTLLDGHINENNLSELSKH